MQTKKTKLAIAIGSIGLFMGAAQLAHAGLVEVNVSPNKVSTFSTDISGEGSDSQPFFAPDVRWTPGENIGANASVRFNLGGKDGDPARFATNAIDVNNFVLVARGVVAGAYTAAAGLTAATTATTAPSAAEATAIVIAADAAVNATAAQRLKAINDAATAATVGGVALASTALLNTADNDAEMAAAANLALGLPAADPIGVDIVDKLKASTVATFDAFPATAITGLVAPVAPATEASYTNGDAAGWVKADGTTPFGRIFQSVQSGGVNSFDVSVLVNVPLRGDADGETDGLTGDSIVLSLNTGKYVNSDGSPRAYSANALEETNVDITNLRAQGFDGKDVPGYGAKGTINIIVSVTQGGKTRDVGTGGNNNRTLFASSANPLQFTNSNLNAGGGLPTTINLAAEELKFSGNHGGTNGVNWFSSDLDLPADSDLFNHIGSFTFDIGDLSSGTPKKYNDWSDGGYINFPEISDPNGNPYALTDGDTINVTIGVKGGVANALAAFTGAGAFFLRAGGDCTDAFDSNSDIALTVDAAAGTASNPNANLADGTTYTVCARANGTTELVPFTATVTAKLQNIEPTYQDPDFPEKELGTWVRNGCDATFFNVPGNGPAATGVDKGFLRFTNTTNASEVAGTVRAKVWGQDGRPVGTGKLLATTGSAGAEGTLKGHQTGVYNAHDVARAIGLSPENDSVNVFPGERVRVVLSGGFATCEGQNMIASPAGVLTNVTVTTNANTNSINTTAREGFAGNNSN